MPWHFNLDDSSLPRENSEGHCSELCLHPDYLLLAEGCSSQSMDLAMCISGRFAKGYISDSVVHIRLL